MISEILDSGDGVVMGMISPYVEGETRVAGVRPVVPVQTHSTNIAEVTGSDMIYPDTDALVTLVPGLPIGVRTADCIPLLFYAPDIMSVGVAHAGWRGTVGGIADLTVRRLVSMGADPGNIQVRIGAGICAECFEVGDETAEAFLSAGFGRFVMKGTFADRINGGVFSAEKQHIDLAGVNRQILEQSGICPRNIRESRICTRHSLLQGEAGVDEYLPSWRRAVGTDVRLLTWIMVKDVRQI